MTHKITEIKIQDVNYHLLLEKREKVFYDIIIKNTGDNGFMMPHKIRKG